MCGRYSLVCIDDLGNRFRVFDPMMGARSRFNIAPGNEMLVITGGDTWKPALMLWGLIPHGTGSPGNAPRQINSRAETIAENASLRPLPGEHRCLVPASGFYEWKKEGSRKVPFYFHLPQTPLFAFAGLCDQRAAPDGSTRRSYSIITCPANGIVAPVHNRMPVILSPGNEDRWLSGEPLDREALHSILVPAPPGLMAMHPVSSRVNSPDAVDDERLVRPLGSFAGT